MKHIATMALVLNLAVAAIYAQQTPVNMTFSGTLEPSTINLQPGTHTDEENVAGNGTLGPFTYRGLFADPDSPPLSSTCPGPTHLYFPTVAGGGVFRFQNGSLLTVSITEGALCIDFSVPVPVGHLTATYQITGGTGRFKSATGTLTLTASLHAVLYSDSNAAVLLTSTGEFEGTVFGVANGEERQDERQ